MLKPNSKFVTLWRIRLLTLGFAAAFLVELVVPFEALKYALLIIWAVFTALIYFLYIPAFFKSCAYEPSSTGIKVRCGVLWLQKQEIKTQNIQYYIVTQAPLETFLKIKNLQIYVAGGSAVLMALTEEEIESVLKCLFESENVNEQ